MGLFDFFKKDETPGYDPANIKITDLDKGFIFEYDLKNWVVEEVYQYDWGSNYKTKEFKVNSGDEIMFLSVDDDDEIFITISEKIKPRVLKDDLPEYINENDKPPKKLEYKNIKFLYDEESYGYFKQLHTNAEEDAKVISWDYFDDDDKYILNIEQWGDEDFEASFGKVVKEFEISNILPNAN
ncbi:MAG: DUF4178 domain-containing protein [Melioribacteraceae bacterium]|nr:DUF4178 domain-containing protein [Melioribacteraceae bacterium]